MPDKEESKGQQFLTRSFLKNAQMAQKNPDANLGQAVSTFTSKNVKALDTLSKQLNVLNKNIMKIAKPSQQKRDFIKREDPNVKLIKEVDDLEELMKQNVEINKKANASKGKGLLGMLGTFGKLIGAGAIGGLVGFLLFGDNKYAKQAREAFKKVGEFIWGGIKEWWDTGGDQFTKDTAERIGKGLLGGVEKVWDWVKANPGKAAMGGLIGALLTGNIGGLTSLATGLASVSLQTVQLLLANPAVAAAAASIGATAYAIWKGKETLQTIKEVKESEKERQKSKDESWTERSSSQKWKMEDQQRLNQILQQENEIQSALYSPTQGSFTKRNARINKTGNQMGLFDRVDIQEKFAPKGKWTPETKRQALEYEFQRLGSIKGSMAKKYGSYENTTMMMPETLISSGIELANDKVNIQGLDPSVYNNLMALGSLYSEKNPGKSIIVNSAFRTYEEQARLHRKYPNKAAPPGRSLHESGLAVDIQTKGKSGFTDWNLASRFGFHRPIAAKEPWHFEFGKRNVGSEYTDSPDQIGDNLPRTVIPNKIQSNNQPIILSEKSIEALAKAIGVSFKGSMPNVKNAVSINAGMRG
jgi:hypothetical protein